MTIDTAVIWTAVGLIGLVLLDWVLAIAFSLKPPNTFNWKLLPDTLRKNVLPYIVPILAIGAASQFNDAIKVFFFTFTAAYTTKLLANIYSKFQDIFTVNKEAPVFDPNYDASVSLRGMYEEMNKPGGCGYEG